MTKHQKAHEELMYSLGTIEESVKAFKSKLEHNQLAVSDYAVMSAYQNLLAQIGSLSWYCTAYAKEAALTEERIVQGLGVA